MDMISMITLHHKVTEDIQGVFLVFLPGKGDVTKFHKMLETTLTEKKILNIELVVAYSGLSREDFNKIHQPSEYRKIIISTNALETAITVKNVIAVFDSMLEKRPTNEETFRLVTTFISKASALQRAGRTGRTTPGICFRMCTKEQYEDFDEYRPAEIETVPLYKIILKMISLNLLPWEVLPKKYGMVKRISDSVTLMKELNIINYKNQISDLGYFYLDLDLSIRATCLIWWWLKSNTQNQYAGLVLSLLINNFNESYFTFDNEEIILIGLDTYIDKYFSKFRGNSDIHTYMNMWLSVLPLINNKVINDISILREWAIENRIDEKKITFFYKTLKNTIIKLNQKGFNIVSLSYNTNEIIDQFLPIIRKVYQNKEYELIKGKYVRDNNNYVLNKLRQINNYDIIKPKYLISFYEINIENISIITLSLNFDPNDIRMFSLDVVASSGLEIRIPKRAHKPDFVSKTTITNIVYPEIDWNRLSFSLNLEPEIAEQNTIEVGKIFPYRQ